MRHLDRPFPAPSVLARGLLSRLRSPATQTDLLQVAKTVVAAVGAWLLAAEVFHLAQPFLAPWTALLTVHATVYRTLSRGAQSVVATVLGIALSVAAVALIGLNVGALALALLVGLLLARLRPLRQEGVAVATTALFVLTTGFEQQQQVLAERFLDVLLGVAVGVVVNLAVYAPLNDRGAQEQVDEVTRQLGGLLRRMAADLREPTTTERTQEWVEASREIDLQVEHAWALVRHTRESGSWNPRRRASRRALEDEATYEDRLRRLEDGVAATRFLSRTVEEATRSAQEWDDRFREPWLDLLDDVGRRVADPEADVAPTRERLDELTRSLSADDLPRLFWPVYGALITGLRHVVTIVDDVVSSGPVRT